ncbi:MAG: VCBS repeat-containing protein, partial [Ginsengibacter sp.]
SFYNEVSPSALNIQYQNKANDFNDFNYERLLPKKYSKNGQGLAVADVNGDGLEDFFVGGAFQQTGQIYIQNKNGTFTAYPLSQYNDGCEDAGAIFFDADNDGDVDLYVVSGGNEFTAANKKYQDRLYKNDGKGNFTLDAAALPVMISSGSCVIAADYDQDGDLDLFTGGRIVPGFYPQTPKSYLLRNDNGKFTDVTDTVAPALRKIGMVTSALWSDINNDSKPDLILAGEWMPVTVLKNSGKGFSNITSSDGLKDTEGWWQGLTAGDFDNDGDIDFIAGNWGLNSPYNVSISGPMRICYKDFDHNGSIDPILCSYEDGVNYPIPSWDYLVDQLPSLRKKIPTYASYASLSMDKLLSMLDTTGMQTLTCKTLQSVYIENLGNGKFITKNLPVQAQFAPLFGMIATDIDHDGKLDLLGAGNFYSTDVIIGKYDAGKGLTLLGDGMGDFKYVALTESGFIPDKDAKAMSRIESNKNGSLIIITQNSDSLKIFKDNTVAGFKRIYPTQNETYAVLNLKNGSKRKLELSYGSGYLSQSSRSLIITPEIQSIELYNYRGIKTRSF